ncbi:fido (protein-threonine AMPylation protein) [Natronospira proteinivora]|uniref:Fido (Protein-threonine AMPylation protein) n=1 Tax=Natronospira proteinivora TaxID=1807133 RepID=A0ABT1G7I3_9GAMM|nr:Fic family protein [Natronospira proteinivora]MCP1727254.1 fido (protein-threonine AMPylation protein) [Natronospira proteinivora]
MTKMDTSDGDLLFATGDATQDKRLRRAAQAGELQRIAPGIYTPILDQPPADILRSPRLWRVLAHKYPGYVVGYRSALEADPVNAGEIFLVGARHRQSVSLPGVTVRLAPGPGALPGDRPFVGDLYWASTPRALLENLTVTRAQKGLPRALGRKGVQAHCERYALREGFGALEALGNQAGRLGQALGLEREAQLLAEIIDAIVGNRSSRGILSASAVLSRAADHPVCPIAEDRFDRLAQALRRTTVPPRPMKETTDQADRRAFIEAYFSNYIEGTRFLIEEAQDLVFRGGPIPGRPAADSHDITSTFSLARHNLVDTIPKDSRELQALIRDRHQVLMAERPEWRPGEFRSGPVSTGAHAFMDAALVRGSLALGYDYLDSLENPFARAVFTLFLVNEVHPFLDGNGRVARLTANAELSAAGQARLIVTTADRHRYVAALRALSRDQNPNELIAICDRAQRITTDLSLNNWDELLAQLRAEGAFDET